MAPRTTKPGRDARASGTAGFVRDGADRATTRGAAARRGRRGTRVQSRDAAPQRFRSVSAAASPPRGWGAQSVRHPPRSDSRPPRRGGFGQARAAPPHIFHTPWEEWCGRGAGNGRVVAVAASVAVQGVRRSMGGEAPDAAREWGDLRRPRRPRAATPGRHRRLRHRRLVVQKSPAAHANSTDLAGPPAVTDKNSSSIRQSLRPPAPPRAPPAMQPSARPRGDAVAPRTPAGTAGTTRWATRQGRQ